MSGEVFWLDPRGTFGFAWIGVPDMPKMERVQHPDSVFLYQHGTPLNLKIGDWVTMNLIEGEKGLMAQDITPYYAPMHRWSV